MFSGPEMIAENIRVKTHSEAPRSHTFSHQAQAPPVKKTFIHTTATIHVPLQQQF